jgi:polyisoprenoid-binding protein YceI
LNILIAALVALAGLVGPAHAQPAATLVPARSEIAFTSTQMGVPVDGHFRRFDATIALDPKQPQTGSVSLAIDAASATLGVPEVDTELVKPNWFDTAKFPQATFQSTGVKHLGAGKFEVAGTLSIKGRAQAIVVPVTVAQSGALSTATGSFTIKRLTFRIGEAEWADTSMVANDVTVRFRLVLTGMPPL